MEATNQSSLSTSCHCPCGILAADLEGATLDIVILRNSIDSIVNSKVGDSSTEKDEINRLQPELSDEKEKTKKLESDIRLIVRERNSEVEELKQIISSLENKVAENVETNISLGLAIKLIMQDNTVNVNKGNQCSLDQNPWTFTNKKADSQPFNKVQELHKGKRTNNSSNPNQGTNNRFSVLKDLHNQY